MPVSDPDFQYVRRLLADDSAMALGDGKEYLVHTRLAPVAEREGLGSVAELIDRVRGGFPDLRRQVVEALVTHETLFFRDLHPFEALRLDIVPELLRANGGRRLSIWSAAAATGQEAYSVALLMREHFPEVTELTILATDISEQVLERARRGVFSQLEVGRGLPVALLLKQFERRGRDWQLRDEVRSMVAFRQLNLAGPLTGVPAMDIVLLRNVLIYFEPAAQTALLERVGAVLRPEGYLLLGGAESIRGVEGTFRRVQIGRSLVYRRVGPQRGANGPDRS
jgi:chemotaxis protein methyltransferase CheR